MICFTSKYNDNETVFNGFCDTVGWIDENVDYDEYRHLQLIRDDFELEKEFRKCIESDVAVSMIRYLIRLIFIHLLSFSYST